MNTKDVLSLLDSAQIKGSEVNIDLQVLDTVETKDFEKWLKKAVRLDIKANYIDSTNIYYSLYTKELDQDKKIKSGLECVQILINAGNLDKASEFLDTLTKLKTTNKRLQSLLLEKKGWIADSHEDPLSQIKFLTQAHEVLSEIPSDQITSDDQERLLTIEHFIARAHYKTYTQKGLTTETKSQLTKAHEIYTKNLAGYVKLNNRRAIAFDHAWLARTAIALGDISEAEKHVQEAKKIFTETSQEVGSGPLLSHSFRIQSELEIAKGNPEQATKFAIEALRSVVPAGAYYNGVLEAVKDIMKASNI